MKRFSKLLSLLLAMLLAVTFVACDPNAGASDGGNEGGNVPPAPEHSETIVEGLELVMSDHVEFEQKTVDWTTTVDPGTPITFWVNKDGNPEEGWHISKTYDIYFTTDGTEPTAKSEVYDYKNCKLVGNSDFTIKAKIALKADPTQVSKVASFDIKVNQNYRKPVSVFEGEKALEFQHTVEKGKGITLILKSENTVEGSIKYSWDNGATFEDYADSVVVEAQNPVDDDIVKTLIVKFVDKDGHESNPMTYVFTWFGPNYLYITQAVITPSNGKYVVITNTGSKPCDLKNFVLAFAKEAEPIDKYDVDFAEVLKEAEVSVLNANESALIYNTNNSSDSFTEWASTAENAVIKIGANIGNFTKDRFVRILKNGQELDCMKNPASFNSAKYLAVTRKYAADMNNTVGWNYANVDKMPNACRLQVLPWAADVEVKYFVENEDKPLVSGGSMEFTTADSQKLYWLSRNDVKQGTKNVYSGSVSAKDEVVLKSGTHEFKYTFTVALQPVKYVAFDEAKMTAAGYKADDWTKALADNKTAIDEAIKLSELGKKKYDSKDPTNPKNYTKEETAKMKIKLNTPIKLKGIVSSTTSDDWTFFVQMDKATVMCNGNSKHVPLTAGDIVEFEVNQIESYRGSIQASYVNNLVVTTPKNPVVYYKNFTDADYTSNVNYNGRDKIDLVKIDGYVAEVKTKYPITLVVGNAADESADTINVYCKDLDLTAYKVGQKVEVYANFGINLKTRQLLGYTVDQMRVVPETNPTV